MDYSNYSMLAITKTTAYEICLIKDSSGNCISQCSTDSSKVVLDVDGNICKTTSCDEANQYLIIPELVCSSKCDTSIYIIKDKTCGLCRDIESSDKYKIVNSTGCLNAKPDNTDYYNEDLYLLVCKRGYKLNGNECITNCYDKCRTCYDYSADESNQLCNDCIDGY